MKTSVVLCMALCALVGHTLAARELKEESLVIPPDFDIVFQVCPPLVAQSCCAGFDFGKVSDGLNGKWPENSTCTIELTGSSVATYIARDEPVPFPGPSEDDSSSMGFFDKLKGAEGMSEDMEPKGSAVKAGGEQKAITFNTKREIEFELVKYEEPNHIWRVPGLPQYCVCPSP